MRRVTPRKRDRHATQRRPVRRKAPPPQARLRLILGAGAGATASLICALWVWRADLVEGAVSSAAAWAIAASADWGMGVEEVVLEGRRNAPRAKLAAAANVRRGDPILGVDLALVRSRLESVPWVRKATVQRRLPNSLRIVIEEREPVALWQRQQRLLLVDRDGVVLANTGLDRFRHLLVVVGKDAPRQTPELIAMLERQPELRNRILAAVWVGSRRWDLRLRSGVDVRLPERDPPSALARLARMDLRHGIFIDGVEVIDLRLPDRLIVRTRAKPVRREKTAGRKT